MKMVLQMNPFEALGFLTGMIFVCIFIADTLYFYL